MAPLAHRLAAPRPQRRRDTCRSSPSVPALQASDRPPCPESRRPRQYGDRAARSACRACRFPCRPCRMACLSRPLSRLQGTAFAAAGGRFRSEEWSRLTGTRRELGCSRSCSWGRGGLPIMGMGRRWRRRCRPVGISGFSKCILRPARMGTDWEPQRHQGTKESGEDGRGDGWRFVPSATLLTRVWRLLARRRQRLDEVPLRRGVGVYHRPVGVATTRRAVLLTGDREVHLAGPNRGWGELACLCRKQSGGVGGSGGVVVIRHTAGGQASECPPHSS